MRHRLSHILGVMVAVLRALTDEARSPLHGDALAIDRFPFRVERETRDPGVVGLVDRRDWDGGEYFLTDRGSVCGTLVEGRRFGGQRQRQRVKLSDHDVIIVDTSMSQLIFKFRTDRPS